MTQRRVPYASGRTDLPVERYVPVSFLLQLFYRQTRQQPAEVVNVLTIWSALLHICIAAAKCCQGNFRTT